MIRVWCAGPGSFRGCGGFAYPAIYLFHACFLKIAPRLGGDEKSDDFGLWNMGEEQFTSGVVNRSSAGEL